MNNIEEIATSFAREYGNDAIYPSHLFKAILHKDIGMVHFIETDLDKDYYYLQEWADVRMLKQTRSVYPFQTYGSIPVTSHFQSTLRSSKRAPSDSSKTIRNSLSNRRNG